MKGKSTKKESKAPVHVAVHTADLLKLADLLRKDSKHPKSKEWNCMMKILKSLGQTILFCKVEERIERSHTPCCHVC